MSGFEPPTLCPYCASVPLNLEHRGEAACGVFFPFRMVAKMVCRCLAKDTTLYLLIPEIWSTLLGSSAHERPKVPFAGCSLAVTIFSGIWESFVFNPLYVWRHDHLKRYNVAVMSKPGDQESQHSDGLNDVSILHRQTNPDIRFLESRPVKTLRSHSIYQSGNHSRNVWQYVLQLVITCLSCMCALMRGIFDGRYVHSPPFYSSSHCYSSVFPPLMAHMTATVFRVKDDYRS